MARSSIEVEYRALAHTATKLSWLGMLLSDLHVPCSSPTLWCDNISVISLSSNPVFHAKTKHIEVDYHYVRKKVAAKQLTICHIPTSDQVADFFTKPLFISRFNYLQSKLMVFSSPINLRGHDNVSAEAAEAQHTSPEEAQSTHTSSCELTKAKLQLKPQLHLTKSVRAAVGHSAVVYM